MGGLLVCNTDNAAYAKAKTSDDSRTVYGGSIKTVKSDKKSGNNAVAQQAEKDSDKDGVADYLEEYFGTSKYRSDTDRDGISDYDELFVLNLNPKKKILIQTGKMMAVKTVIRMVLVTHMRLRITWILQKKTVTATE